MDVFRQFAEVIEPEEVDKFVASLERFLDDRPDLWQAWSVNVQGLVLAHRAEEAVSLAQEAAERFPLTPRVWVDVAEASAHAGRADDRLDALEQAAAVAPGWVPAARELADALADAGHDADAVAALERAAWRSPLDPVAHWFLAERLWQAGRSRDGAGPGRAGGPARHRGRPPRRDRVGGGDGLVGPAGRARGGGRAGPRADPRPGRRPAGVAAAGAAS